MFLLNHVIEQTNPPDHGDKIRAPKFPEQIAMVPSRWTFIIAIVRCRLRFIYVQVATLQSYLGSEHPYPVDWSRSRRSASLAWIQARTS
jgi:hypothetical protein